MRMWLWLLLPLALLGGCGNGDLQDLQEFVKNSGAGLRGQIKPPPDIKPYAPFTYNNDSGLPDPFKPRKADPKKGHGGFNQPDMTRPHEMLEEYPLESLKMTGFVRMAGVSYAVIRSPDGKVHKVRAGNYMGQNYGQITSVNESGVTVKELVEDGNGDWSEKISTLQLIE